MLQASNTARIPCGFFFFANGSSCHEGSEHNCSAGACDEVVLATLNHNGVTYCAEYEGSEGMPLVFLPDDSSRENLLHDRDPEAAALECLLFYIHTLEDEARRGAG